MSLYIVSTPIGNPLDITLRALDVLKTVPVVIGEERKITLRTLKTYKIDVLNKQIDFLNEHSEDSDVRYLFDNYKGQDIALISDCGTPVFCDPGTKLIALFRKNKIPIIPISGISSLMTIISLSGVPLGEFWFCGFLPQKTEKRLVQLKKIKDYPQSIVLMDTPYRLNKLLTELKSIIPFRIALLGINLTSEKEDVRENTIEQLCKNLNDSIKEEFILLIYPKDKSISSQKTQSYSRNKSKSSIKRFKK